MCAAIGLNVSADGRAGADLVKSLGATWVRIVAKKEIDQLPILMSYQNAGLRTMLVYARESFEHFGSWAEGLAWYARQYSMLVAAWQIGNEPDLTGDSSWTMSVDELCRLGRLARAALPGRHIVCAGMASGHPSYLDGADLSWCDSLACHPYLRDAPNPNDLEDLADMDVLVREYQRFGKPVVVSEYGWWGAEEGRAVAEVDDAIKWAADTDDCGAFFYFAALDDVPPFGLIDANGQEKPRAAAFKRRAAGARDLGWPHAVAPVPPPAPKPVPTEDAALIAAWRAHWQAIVPTLDYHADWAIPSAWRAEFPSWGSPIAGEIDGGNGVTFQPFSNAVIKYSPANGVERIA